MTTTHERRSGRRPAIPEYCNHSPTFGPGRVPFNSAWTPQTEKTPHEGGVCGATGRLLLEPKLPPLHLLEPRVLALGIDLPEHRGVQGSMRCLTTYVTVPLGGDTLNAVRFPRPSNPKGKCRAGIPEFCIGNFR